MPRLSDASDPSPEVQLQSFLARFDATTQERVRSIRAALRERFPTAHELAYDYTSHVVIAYGPTERGIEAVVAMDARPEEVRLSFNQGPRLADPGKLLRGKGKQTRYIVLASAARLEDPEVEALIVGAIQLSSVPLPASGEGALSIRGAATKPRARRAPRS